MKKYLIIKSNNKTANALGERGMALLLTLMVTIILAVVVLEFNYLIRVYATLSSNLVDDLKAQAAARGSIEKAKALLLNDLAADDKKGIHADTLQEEWAAKMDYQTTASAAEAQITDEMSKLNLNSLIKHSNSDVEIESVNREMVGAMKHLFELLELDPNLVDCIIDWMDENDQEEPFGAENAYYESLSPPAICKNGPLDSVEELLLIKDFTPEILYGDEENPGLTAYVTVFGDVKGTININTADEKVISAVLNSESTGSMIVDMRENDPFETAADMSARLPDVEIGNKMAAASSYFLVSATGRTPIEGDPLRQVHIKALLKREMPEGLELEEDYMRVNTAYWKMGR